MAGWHVTSVGPSQAPRVVCLHGFLGQGEDWRPLAERCGDRFQLDLVDLPGHGHSLQQAPDDYTFAGAVTHLREWIQGAYAVVGYSMGGRLALASTLAGIAGLRALVIVSATPGIEDDSARQARRSEDERRAARLEKDGLSAFVSTWYAQPLFASLDHQPSLREDLIRRRTSGSSVELARALRGLSVGQQPSYWGELSRLPMPSLWVAGAEDTVYMKLTERAASLSPSSRTLMVRHSGHMPHGERPAECLGGIVDFLDQHLE